jgi:hypothetical protein
MEKKKKRFLKPEQSDVNEALPKWLQQHRSGNVPVSGHILMISFVLSNFNFK